MFQTLKKKEKYFVLSQTEFFIQSQVKGFLRKFSFIKKKKKYTALKCTNYLLQE